MLAKSKNYKEKVYFVLLLVSAALIPTAEASPVKFASISVILLTVWWIASGDYTAKYNKLKNNKLALLFISLFLISLLSLIRTDNLSAGADLIMRKLSLLLFPLIISSSPRLTNKQVNHVILAFIVSLLLTSLLTFREGIVLILNRADLTNLVRLVYIHRPYFGLFCAFAIVGLIHFIKFYKSAIVKSILMLVIAYFLFFIYILYAKMTVVALTALFIALLATTLVKKLPLYMNLVVAACLMLSVYFVWRTNESVRVIYSKITKFEDFSYQEYNIHLVSSINIRYINWGCSVRILQQDQNWLTGLGVGNVQQKLNDCYEGLNPWIFEEEQNAHNEYLEEMLRNGVVGLTLLLLSLGIPLVLSYKQGNYLYFSFIVLFGICCVTEDMLSRQTGIMFFALFHSLFAFNTLKTKVDFKSKK